MKRQTITLSLLLVLITKINAGWLSDDFCSKPNEPIPVTTLHSASKNLSHTDKAILDFAPIVYFYSGYIYAEEYFPLTMESYLAVGKPAIVYKKGHRKDPKNPEIIVPSGEVTMATLADTKKFKDIENPGDNLYLQVGNNAGAVHCIDYGDNPKLEYKDQNGNLFTAREKEQNKEIIKTPYYAIYSQDACHDYIQYLFLYGYNGDYKIAYARGTGVGYHKMDLEHFTLQFEKDSIKNGKPKLLQAAFPSHGSGETRWLAVDNKDLQVEGKHPIVYAAYHGHGIYPEAGTYIRICGFGNDYTSKGIKWQPDNIIRLYRNKSDSHYSTNKFNEIMGWVKFPGDLGPEGVGGLVEKQWFGQPQFEEIGKDYKEHFCPEGIAGNKVCNATTIPFTCYEPETQQAYYTNNTKFDPEHLPNKFIKIDKGTTLIFYKRSNPELTAPEPINKNYAGNLQTFNTTFTDQELVIEVGPCISGVKIQDDNDTIELKFIKPGKFFLQFSSSDDSQKPIRTEISVEG